MPVRAYLYPFLAMLLWAGNVVVSKLAASSIAPTAITTKTTTVSVGKPR